LIAAQLWCSTVVQSSSPAVQLDVMAMAMVQLMLWSCKDVLCWQQQRQ
jgi:hypothetical protein